MESNKHGQYTITYGVLDSDYEVILYRNSTPEHVADGTFTREVTVILTLVDGDVLTTEPEHRILSMHRVG